MKRIIAILIIVAVIPSMNAFAISKNEPLKQLGKGMDNVLYGTLESPDNITGKTEGQKAFSKTTDATKDDVGRGIARVIGGIWQIATFWYPTDTDAKPMKKR